MAIKKSKTEIEGDGEAVSLSSLLSKDLNADTIGFKVWLVGQTPLICHAWSEKARREMLGKQVNAIKPAKERRDPEMDFKSSLYEMGNDRYGFPATAIKNCLLAVAHKDKGLPRSVLQSAVWIDSEMISTRPALPSATCDMPLVRIYGSTPLMREDMVKIGKGLNRTANLAYRAQFSDWAIRITGSLNTATVQLSVMAALLLESGKTVGIGEWRPEKRGQFGSFRLARREEEVAWEAFAEGTGPLPVTANMKLAA